ncbi:MAG TPA: phosphoesterase, partial [Ruminococcus sp.]|nr:phosphoesterase [Ruminococcus sp.]
MTKKAKKRLIVIIVLLILVLLSAWGFTMRTVHYSVKSPKLRNGMRIVFISDLHNCFYGGTDQSGIIDEVHKADPDIVIFGGDVIDAWGR